MKSFEKTLEVRWSDCDPNRHVTHSKYYDYGAHCRVSFFIESGFNTEKMAELQIGPILFKEECTFIKELKIQDTVRVNILKGEISEDGGRWTVHHEIFNQKGDKCAHITAKGIKPSKVINIIICFAFTISIEVGMVLKSKFLFFK